jgi:hypothetical protein
MRNVLVGYRIGTLYLICQGIEARAKYYAHPRPMIGLAGDMLDCFVIVFTGIEKSHDILSASSAVSLSRSRALML